MSADLLQALLRLARISVIAAHEIGEKEGDCVE